MSDHTAMNRMGVWIISGILTFLSLEKLFPDPDDDDDDSKQEISSRELSNEAKGVSKRNKKSKSTSKIVNKKQQVNTKRFKLFESVKV